MIMLVVSSGNIKYVLWGYSFLSGDSDVPLEQNNLENEWIWIISSLLLFQLLSTSRGWQWSGDRCWTRPRLVLQQLEVVRLVHGLGLSVPGQPLLGWGGWHQLRPVQQVGGQPWPLEVSRYVTQHRKLQQN